jgi:hypothetical protein
MRRISLFLMGALVALAQPVQRPGTLQSGEMGMFRNGVGYNFRYTTIVEPPPAQMSDIRITGGTTADPKNQVVHRQMNDDLHHLYFGYDLTAVVGPGSGHYTVTISPPTLQSTTSTLVPLPKYPPPMVVNDGDTVALDLLVSADGKQKVVDYFQITGQRDPSPATSTAEPRDYTPDDGTVRLAMDRIQVVVNGQPSGAGTGVGVTIKPGSTIWLSAPNEGRYILSVVPHDGFQQTGTIRDNVISFQSDGQQYEIRTLDPILGSKGAWNLYVMHDAQFRAKSFISLGLDRLENLLPKH